jgi:hypothetical protein
VVPRITKLNSKHFDLSADRKGRRLSTVLWRGCELIVARTQRNRDWLRPKVLVSKPHIGSISANFAAFDNGLYCLCRCGGLRNRITCRDKPNQNGKRCNKRNCTATRISNDFHYFTSAVAIAVVAPAANTLTLYTPRGLMRAYSHRASRLAALMRVRCVDAVFGGTTMSGGI